MSVPSSQEGDGSSMDPVMQARLRRIVALRRRFWAAFTLFLIAPFIISVLMRSDASAMAVAAALVVAALWTSREIAKTPCPSCGSTYFSREESGRRTYNIFSSACMSCRWSSK